jgi:hypothetical protein
MFEKGGEIEMVEGLSNVANKGNDKTGLKDFVKRNSRYVSADELVEGVTGVFKGFKVAQDPFDDTKEVVFYTLGMGVKDRVIRSGSQRLASAMSQPNVQVGKTIEVKRTGEKFETKYSVTVKD